MDQLWQLAQSLGKLQIAFFGIGVALDPLDLEGQIRGYERTSLTRSATGSNGREQFMIIGGFGLYQVSALILILVAAWSAKKPIAAFFKSYTTSRGFADNLLAARWSAPKPILAQKNCPHCAEPMPISVLFCDACDYNFLSGSLGTRQKSLPSPSSTERQISKPHLVSSRF